MPAGRAEANPERIAVAGSARLGGVRFEPEKMEAGRAVVSVRMMTGVNGASPHAIRLASVARRQVQSVCGYPPGAQPTTMACDGRHPRGRPGSVTRT